MKDSTTTLLNDLSSRLDCDVLAEDNTERDLHEKFSETKGRVTTVADEIKKFASPEDAFAFTTKLSTFLEGERALTLEANRLKDAIADKASRINEAQGEISYLSAGRRTLAEKVNHAMLTLEQAQCEYADHELSLGILERRIEAARLERAVLRRQLAELTRSKEVNNK